jgi:hypothetical protein
VIDAIPQAVFKDRDPIRAQLLSYFLQPSPYFIPDILYEISLVERQAIETSGFETAHVNVLFFRNQVVIEPQSPEIKSDRSTQVTLTLEEAKLLLLEWGVALERWRMRQK